MISANKPCVFSFLVLVCFCLLTGCPVEQNYVVVNHTNDSIVIEIPGQDVVIAAQQSFKKPGGFPGDGFTIQRGKKNIYYNFPSNVIPQDYTGPGPHGLVRYIQLNPDNCFYLLRPTQVLPVVQLPPQPPGFPIRPKGERSL